MEHARSDGFILPDGEFIAIEDAERMCAQARTWLQSPQEVWDFLCALAQECAAKAKYAAAQTYFELILERNESKKIKAFCLLSIGQLQEQQENYAAAVDWYRKAFRMRPGTDGTWYLLHNNLGYCLNRFACYPEAEELCRKAIAMDPSRHNAHKNLGIALEGQGSFVKAAQAYLAAAEICPDDPRALRRLEYLIAIHPEIEERLPGLCKRMEHCRRCCFTMDSIVIGGSATP
jgi:tetratricopeptide (TPR) repeat protein